MTDTSAQVEELKELLAVRDARIRDLETVLGLNDKDLGALFKLPRGLARLLGLLMAVPNVTPHMVEQQLEITRDTKVAIHRLRGDLDRWCEEAKVDYRLPVQSRRTLGYWLDNETKARIRGLVTPAVTTIQDNMSEPAGSDMETA